jgi:intein/homing endonuclease
MVIPKQIPKDLVIHFIRGYFDGDGCITYSIRKPNPNNREKNYRVTGRFEICAKTSSLLLEFQ